MPGGLHGIAGSEAGILLNRHGRPSSLAYVTSTDFGTAFRYGLIDCLPDLESMTLILNRATMQGGLKRSQVEEALGHPIQVTSPDLPRETAKFVRLGQSATAASFRSAVADIAEQIGINRQNDPAARSKADWRPFRRS